MDSWINGKLNKKEDGYYIDDTWILWDWEEDVITKGIKELYKKYKFKSVLELGFGVGWTATEFQKQGVERHVILEPNKESYNKALKWNKNYNAEIINIFSWEYEPKEKFDLIYDDIVEFESTKVKHHTFPNKFKNQWYTKCAYPPHEGISNDYPIDFELNKTKYRQNLRRI